MSPSAGLLVVADDLTGANATAAALSRAGVRAVTITGQQEPEVIAELAGQYEALVVSADSRHVDPDEAADLVRAAVRAAWPVRLVANRIDSTFRGNVSVTTAAVMAEVAEQSGRRVVGLCSPAHPEAGRQTVDGTQLLDGIRLEDTELAADPRSPVRGSDVAGLIGADTGLQVGRVGLADVTGDNARLAQAVRARLDAGDDVVVADALTLDHLDRIAVATASVIEDETLVAIDSGPGTVALALALGLGGVDSGAPLLVASGSATGLTRRQLARLHETHDVLTVQPVLDDDQVPDVDQTAEAVGWALEDAEPGQVVLIATALVGADVRPIDRHTGELIPRRLARVVRRVLEEHRVDGLLATGGDVASALFAELGAYGLDVEEEVEPLAVAGSFVGGPWSGLPVITKGGLVGGPDTIAHAVDFLRGSAERRRRYVHAASTRLDRPGR